MFDMLRAGDTLVVRWVDRLGRNYADVTDTIQARKILPLVRKLSFAGTTWGMPLQNTPTPVASSHETKISEKANYEASEIRFDQILSVSSTIFWPPHEVYIGPRFSRLRVRTPP